MTQVEPEERILAGDGDADPSMSALRILVAEDDEADAHLIDRALAHHPRVEQVVRVPDGVAALALLDEGEFEPDLAIIDLHMPRKNGFNLLLELSCRRRPCFPMVVLTSSRATCDAVRSRLRGAAGVIAKPDTVEEFDTVLWEAIDALFSGPTRPRQEPELRRIPAG